MCKAIGLLSFDDHRYQMLHHFIPQVLVILNLLSLKVLANLSYLLDLVILVLREIAFTAIVYNKKLISCALPIISVSCASLPALSSSDHLEYKSSNWSAMMFIDVILQVKNDERVFIYLSLSYYF